MAGERFDPVRALVDLIIDVGGLFYTKPCLVELQIHIQLHFLNICTKRSLDRLHYDLDKVAIKCGCTFIDSNVDDGFVVYGIGSRAREFEIGFGEVLMNLPEYRPVMHTALQPVGTYEQPLQFPERIDLQRHLQMPNPDAYFSAIALFIRMGEYMWAKQSSSLPTNFRRELEASIQYDYRPLVARAEGIIGRAVEFHRIEGVQLPSFLACSAQGRVKWDD